MNILILSILSNPRYQTAGEAIKEYMEQNIECCSVHIISIFKYMNPFIDRLESDGLLKNGGKPHHLNDTACGEDDLSKSCSMLNDALCMKLNEIIGEITPDVIISEHPYMLQLLSTVIKKDAFDIPVIALTTTFDPCREWMHGFVKAYIVPSAEAKNKLIEEGVEEGKIYPFGIPVKDAFSMDMDRTKLFHELKLINKKTLLIWGTRMGDRKAAEIFKHLAYSNLDVQIIFYGPFNTNLQKHLCCIAANCSKNIKICGLKENVSALMAVSDIIITKPESIIISEALAKNLPIAVVSPTRGPMRHNAEYLLENDAAVLISKNENPADILGPLMSSDMKIELMKQNIKKIARPYAVMDTAQLILNLSGNSAGSIHHI